MSFRFSGLSVPVLAGLLGASPSLLKAEEVTFGFQAGLAQPSSSDLKDLVDSRLGFTLGAHALVDFGSGHGLRPRIDYTRFKGSLSKDALEALAEGVLEVDPAAVPITRNDTQVNIVSLGADYTYAFNGKAGEGPYVIGGLGYSSVRRQGDITVLEPSSNQTGTGHFSRRSGTMNYRVGIGYGFNRNIAVELTQQFMKVSDLIHEVQLMPGAETKAVSLDANLNSTVLGVTWRF